MSPWGYLWAQYCLPIRDITVCFVAASHIGKSAVFYLFILHVETDNYHVCMYVCMYACVYVSMYVHMHVCTYVCMYVCMYVCVYIYIYMCVYVYVCVLALLCGPQYHSENSESGETQ